MTTYASSPYPEASIFFLLFHDVSLKTGEDILETNNSKVHKVRF
jgi:hypothetical protein